MSKKILIMMQCLRHEDVYKCARTEKMRSVGSKIADEETRCANFNNCIQLLRWKKYLVRCVESLIAQDFFVVGNYSYR